MISDCINDEILRIKHELAAVHENDVRRIAADARSRQRNTITLPPRPIVSEQSDARAFWKWFEDKRVEHPPE